MDEPRYYNRVVFGSNTLIDISDTTAQAADVAQGKKFYTADGAPCIGTHTDSGGGADGGGGSADDPVKYYDYDGTLVASYSAADFASLTEHPANPAHTGLTAQGWNWTLVYAQEYVAQYGALDIGQMYTTDDGTTRIYIHLVEGRLKPALGMCPNGSVDVDWGDGTAHSTVMGTSLSNIIWSYHNYAAPGDYVIKLAVTGSMRISGAITFASRFLVARNASTTHHARAYQNAIERIEIGSGVEIGAYAFTNCSRLQTVILPKGLQSIGNNAFSSCYKLRYVVIPNTVTEIGNSAFFNCYDMEFAVLPEKWLTIGSSAFRECYSFKSCPVLRYVSSLGESAFYQCYNMQRVVITNGYTGIGSSVFAYCSSLISLTIPQNMTSIGSTAFSNCGGLEEIIFKPQTPPTLGSSSTFEKLRTCCVIHVPAGTLSAYTSASRYPSSDTYTYVEDPA